jgi:two-component system response regulator (stage 0 sporulation protein A)
MSILELQVETLMRLCAAEEETERLQAKEDLRRMLAGHPTHKVSSDPEYLIRELLLEMGTPDHLVGHPYVVQAVLLAVEDRSFIDNLTTHLYPQLAVMFQTVPARVERAIRSLVELTWTRGNWDVLNRYFGNAVRPIKGKPTNGEFLARLTNIVTLRMREIA